MEGVAFNTPMGRSPRREVRRQKVRRAQPHRRRRPEQDVAAHTKRRPRSHDPLRQGSSAGERPRRRAHRRSRARTYQMGRRARPSSRSRRSSSRNPANAGLYENIYGEFLQIYAKEPRHSRATQRRTKGALTMIDAICFVAGATGFTGREVVRIPRRAQGESRRSRAAGLVATRRVDDEVSGDRRHRRFDAVGFEVRDGDARAAQADSRLRVSRHGSGAKKES